MDGFQKRKERKKESIRRAALELFLKHGVHKVSVAEIARKASVSQVTIYNYFGSKDELLLDVIEAHFDQQWDEYLELLESSLPFSQKMEELIFKKTKALSTVNPDFLQTILSNDPRIRSIVERIYPEKAEPALIQFFLEGQKEGAVNPHVSIESIMLYVKLISEAVIRSNLTFVPSEQIRLYKELTELVFYGVLIRNPQS